MVPGYTIDSLYLSGFQVNKARKAKTDQRKEKLLLTILITKREIQFKMVLS